MHSYLRRPLAYDILRVSSGSDVPSFLKGFQKEADREKTSALQRVLVVDDERLIADTVAQILNFHGFDAFAAYSGDDALKLAERFRPDVLLTDVMMPVMNGMDLARAVEEMLPAVKVLLFSGQAGSNALLQTQRVTEAHFHVVAKPIHPEKLVDAVRNLKSRG